MNDSDKEHKTPNGLCTGTIGVGLSFLAQLRETPPLDSLFQHIKPTPKGDTMTKIKILKSPSADTRTADHEITPDELLESTQMHI